MSSNWVNFEKFLSKPLVTTAVFILGFVISFVLHIIFGTEALVYVLIPSGSIALATLLRYMFDPHKDPYDRKGEFLFMSSLYSILFVAIALLGTVGTALH